MIKELKPGEFYGDVRLERTVPDVHLTETLYEPGLKIPKHFHELPYFCLVLDGTYRETYSRASVDCDELSVVFHPPKERHFGEIGPEGCRTFNAEVGRRFVDKLYDYTAMPESSVDLTGGVLNWLAIRLYHEHCLADACSPLAIEGLVLEMLASAARGRKPSEKRAPDWLGRVEELLREEFRDSLRVGEVASRIGVHPVHLSRVFRRHYGQSIGDFVRHLRIRFACHRLAAPEANLADVALAAGFADQSQFSRAFKQLTGMTPGAFRKNLGPPAGTER